jgi:hypothetical protein
MAVYSFRHFFKLKRFQKEIIICRKGQIYHIYSGEFINWLLGYLICRLGYEKHICIKDLTAKLGNINEYMIKMG